MPSSPPFSARTAAQVAQKVALGLRVGPLAAASSSMGPLAYRVGYRGGPGGSTPGGENAGHHHDEKLIDYVAIGVVAALPAPELARSPASLLTRASPILKGIRALGERGATLTHLQIAVLAALRVSAEAGKSFRADELHTQLNRAASDDLETWSSAKIHAALDVLLGVPLRDGQRVVCVEAAAERWRAL